MILTRILFTSACAILAFMPISFAATNIAIVTGIFTWLALLFTKTNKPTFPPLLIPFLLLLTAGLISLTNTPELHTSLRGLSKITKAFFIYAVIREAAATQGKTKILINCLLISSAIVAIDGITQYITGTSLIRQYPVSTYLGDIRRITGPLPQPNILGQYLGAVIPIAIALFFKPKQTLQTRGLLFILISALGLSFLWCFSRSAALGLFTAMILFTLISRNKVIPVFIVLTLLISPFILPPTITQWVKNQGSVSDALFGGDAKDNRFLEWEASINMIKAHPWTGVGANTYTMNYAQYRAEEEEYSTSYAHNSYLQLGAELGIPGLLALAAIILTLITGFIKTWTRDPHNWLALGVFLGISAFLVNCISESGLHIAKISVLFWILAGLLQARSSETPQTTS